MFLLTHSINWTDGGGAILIAPLLDSFGTLVSENWDMCDTSLEAQCGSKLTDHFNHKHAILMNYFLILIHSGAKQVHCTFGILRKIPKKGPQSTEKQFFRFFWYIGMRKLFDKFTVFVVFFFVSKSHMNKSKFFSKFY